MRFLTRAAAGLGLTLLTLALIAFGGRSFLACAPGLDGVVGACAFNEDDGERRGGRNRERAFTVAVGVIENGVATPEIAAVGELVAGRVLELRAGAEGQLAEIAPDFRDGAFVEAGALLFRVDPADLEARQADAAAALADAEAEAAEAARALAFAEADAAAAVEQRDLRRVALDRQSGLEARGFSTEAAIETARIALADAERAVITRDSARVAAEKRVERARLSVARAEIGIGDAARDLADARVVAPFSGLIETPTAVAGRFVARNELLGRLIDPTALEVAFRLPDSAFGRLLDASGALSSATVRATLELGDRSLSGEGRLVRVGARAGAADGGRRLFARLSLAADTPLRPGDFVSVTVLEPPLENVARIPARAAALRRSVGGAPGQAEILLAGADDRLTAATVTVLRREGDALLVRGAPEGARVVLERRPQLGPGVRVTAIDPEAPAPEPEPRRRRGGESGDANATPPARGGRPQG